jgi:hypothetical protein
VPVVLTITVEDRKKSQLFVENNPASFIHHALGGDDRCLRQAHRRRHTVLYAQFLRDSICSFVPDDLHALGHGAPFCIFLRAT